MSELWEKVSEVIGTEGQTIVLSTSKNADELARDVVERIIKKNPNQQIFWMSNDDFKTGIAETHTKTLEEIAGYYKHFVFVRDITEHYDPVFFELSTAVKEIVKFRSKTTIWISPVNKQKEWVGHFDYVFYKERV